MRRCAIFFCGDGFIFVAVVIVGLQKTTLNLFVFHPHTHLEKGAMLI